MGATPLQQRRSLTRSMAISSAASRSSEPSSSASAADKRGNASTTATSRSTWCVASERGWEETAAVECRGWYFYFVPNWKPASLDELSGGGGSCCRSSLSPCSGLPLRAQRTGLLWKSSCRPLFPLWFAKLPRQRPPPWAKRPTLSR